MESQFHSYHYQYLRHCDLLAGLSEQFFLLFFRELSSRACAAGQVLLKEGEKADELIFLCTGEVELLVGRELKRVARLSGPSFFGEDDVLQGGRRPATVRALTPCDSFVITRAALLELLANFPLAKSRFAAKGTQPLQAPAARIKMPGQIESPACSPAWQPTAHGGYRPVWAELDQAQGRPVRQQAISWGSSPAPSPASPTWWRAEAGGGGYTNWTSARACQHSPLWTPEQHPQKAMSHPPLHAVAERSPTTQSSVDFTLNLSGSPGNHASSLESEREESPVKNAADPQKVKKTITWDPHFTSEGARMGLVPPKEVYLVESDEQKSSSASSIRNPLTLLKELATGRPFMRPLW